MHCRQMEPAGGLWGVGGTEPPPSCVSVPCVGWRGHITAEPTHTLAASNTHQPNRTEGEMHYLNFHHYFSPLLPLFLLIYFSACFPQAALPASFSFPSVRQLPESALHSAGCPLPRSIATLPRAQQGLGKLWTAGHSDTEHLTGRNAQQM